MKYQYIGKKIRHVVGPVGTPKPSAFGRSRSRGLDPTVA